MKIRGIFNTSLAWLPMMVMPSMAQSDGDRPNILVIVGDDMAATELSCHGGQNLLTPNIDRLASEGLQMTNTFASCAMSIPIRASLYTGLYPARSGSYQNHKATYSTVESVTRHMSDLGYRVGRPAVEFYDLKRDPWEMNNLAENRKYAKRIARMRAELERWMNQQGGRGELMDTENPEQYRGR